MDINSSTTPLPIFISLERSIIYSSVVSFYAIESNSVFNLSYGSIGIVMFVIISSGAAFQLVGGKSSDAIGRRAAAIIGQIVQSIGLVLMGNSFIFHDLFDSILGFFLINIGGNLVQSSINAIGPDLSENTSFRVSYFAKIRTAINSGFGFGPLIIGILLTRMSYGFFTELLGLVSTVSMIFFYKIRGKPLEKISTKLIVENHRKFPPTQWPLIKISISALLLSLLFGQLTSSIPVYEQIVNNLSVSQIGILIGANGFMIVLIQFPISRLVKNIFNWKWMTTGAAIYSVSIILLSLANLFSSVLIIIIILTLGEAIFWGTAQALVSYLSDRASFGRDLGIFSFSITLGRGIGAEYGLYLFSLLIAYHTIFWSLIAIPGLISTLLFSIFVYRIGKLYIAQKVS